MSAALALDAERARRRRSRRTLLVLAAVAAFPFVAAWLFYFNPHWLPAPSAQHGTLLDPPLPLDTLALRDHAGTPLALPERSWIVLVVEPAECADACLLRGDALRRARRATGVARERVARVVALPDPRPAVAAELRRDAPDVQLAALDPALRALADGAPTVLLGDPHGRLMMRYPGDTPAEAILSDLKRLLRVSRSW